MKQYICDMNELQLGKPKRFDVEGRRIAVVRHATGVTAFEPFCPHARADLIHARYEGDTVCCHWHGWSFDLQTGAGLNNDASLKLYDLTVEAGRILVHVPEDQGNETVDDDYFIPEIKWKSKDGD